MRLRCVVAVASILLGAHEMAARADDTPARDSWASVFRISPGARLDAVTDLGNGIALVGSRGTDSGRIAISRDYGQTWINHGQVITGNVLNLLALSSNNVLASTLEGEIWKSTDQGASWRKTQKISEIRVYGMTLTDQGTVLACNYDNENGGHLFRSTDAGETWSDLGVRSPKGLYRFQKVRDGVLVNGVAGRLYKSRDDGLNWVEIGQISDRPLYPIESLPTGVVLLGDEAGRIFRSTDDGVTWKEVANTEQPLDDFVWMRDGLIYLSSYLGTKHLFVSNDAGLSWKEIGPTPDGDVLDHVIALKGSSPSVAVGGTTEGRILRLVAPAPAKTSQTPSQ